MYYISLDAVLALHRRIIQTSGGSMGVRDHSGLESAIAQPFMTFGGQDLYPTVIEKAAALCFSLIRNHPFVDGNKRVGHAAMEVFLRSNEYRIDATVDMQEQIILGVASGEVSREQLVEWLREHICELH
ncbi:MAG: type II toxin-antitoxin system death-on-curing family toxin [Gemmatimonadetes bacterium]|nr:type II toxin-antitoxin system death-on-curing family toxin [Gemmatimonadota bacterium]MYF74065.1 type II toxin-antitoxin system death-on-curing family toxin [Gemmatimonadota bacterium]MYK54248.1 type II toxin-antitoxin system death-on-curing family toxin [Gemmatimonadota bacterium]